MNVLDFLTPFEVVLVPESLYQRSTILMGDMWVKTHIFIGDKNSPQPDEYIRTTVDMLIGAKYSPNFVRDFSQVEESEILEQLHPVLTKLGLEYKIFIPASGVGIRNISYVAARSARNLWPQKSWQKLKYCRKAYFHVHLELVPVPELHKDKVITLLRETRRICKQTYKTS